MEDKKKKEGKIRRREEDFEEDPVTKKPKRRQEDSVTKNPKRRRQEGDPVSKKLKRRRQEEGPVSKKLKRRQEEDPVSKKLKRRREEEDPVSEKLKRRREEEDGAKQLRNSMKNCRKKEEQSQGESSVHSARPRPSVETRLSLERFTLHKMLGIGGFGKVLLASDKETKKLLALKIVRKVDLICEDPDTALIEQRALKISSGCRFFTKLHGTFQTQSHLCYAMEYLHGGNLDCYIKRNRMTIRAATFFAAELACGLQFLHSEGIIHRDLKPQNILLDTVGHIRIADFGLAFQVKDGMMSAEGHVGTEGFIAPEVRKGERYNAAVDWWSCGVVLYQMAKRLCHHEDLTYDECGRHATKDIIKKLLSKDPSERLGFVRSIHCHPFFQNIDWKKLEAGNVIPPFILSTPSLDSVRSLVMKESMVLDYALPLSEMEQQLFLGFSFVNSQCDIFHH